MSTWQQSKRTETGDRDTVQLYSYSARFRRISREAIPAAIVASYFGVDMLSQLQQDRSRADSLLDAATRLADLADAMLSPAGQGPP